ncbi:hypothetical protein RJT34_14091 [Clitoria ternatea]|uniref:Uncharacterized protein n=1 Tax=Clitoria ternatea TaxID=43366 RepID=A0AAN9JT82_CLITE
MGTEVLQPQDCLTQRIRVPSPSISRRRYYANLNYPNNYYYYYNNSGIAHRKLATRPEHKKRVGKRKLSSDDSKIARSSEFVMEKVKILRRGESLDSIIKSEALKKGGDDLVVVGTQRLRPDPEMVPKEIPMVDFNFGCDIYAGSAFAMSPAPSALPLPSFSRKQATGTEAECATRDLRRLLRLE